jgi:acyl-CoA synthetase (AMP-forming)/AMP-acid ligase II/alpha-ketoglutarate-dependent taurine dioxygenase
MSTVAPDLVRAVPPVPAGRGQSLPALVAAQAARTPQAVAVAAPGQGPLTYAGLQAHLAETVGALRALGVRRGDRVALVVATGAELGVAFVTVAAGVACAPLNPAYRAGEFEFFLSDLRARLLVVQAGLDTAAREAARKLGIPCVELAAVPGGPAGAFTLGGRRAAPADPAQFSGPDDVALLLHTSGTTSRPKLVPLTHANLYAAAQNIRAALRLTPDDRCLNVMPLFHIHGMSTVFASLAAGASVVCPPGFQAPRFYEWMDAFRPTWYTAAPTIHQAILDRAAANREIIARSPLRFIRSASASMAPQVIAEMERVFNAPFIEAYGMTEAAPQIAANPLPPGQRKYRSVGLPAGPDVAIMDAAGNLLRPGEVGEVVVRGANIMRGYENNPEANAAAFTHGWFRTGDQGYRDDEGYLYITGRIKEIINRGGEKVSPREVEEVLLDHPAVAQAVCFAVANPRLGEEVAAAVVFRPGASAGEQELREFTAARLADFKVPCQVVALAELPKGHTAKVQRIGLAEKLGLTARDQTSAAAEAAYVAPRPGAEEALARIWAEVLGVERVGAHDDFFHLGGDSILAVQILARAHKELGVNVGVLSFFGAPTVAGMAAHVDKAPRAAEAPAIRPAPRDGDLPLSFTQEGLWFADQLSPGNPVYNNYRAVRLAGPLDRAALQQALDGLVRRHEILRTTLPTRDGQPVQVIAPAVAVPLAVVDVPAAAGRSDESCFREEICRPFDLAQGPLLRVTLFRMANEEHVLLVVAHHIITDGWSMATLLTDLAALYSSCREGRPSPLPPLPVQYADFAVWERQRLGDAYLRDLLAYWKEQLAGAPACLDLPTARPRPAAQSFRGARRFRTLPPALVAAARSLGKRQDATLFMTLLAAFQALLYRYTNQEDLVVGSHVAGRDRVETEGVVGDFTNTLALRAKVAGDVSFREVLARVRKAAVGAYAHKDLPFGKLLEALRPPRLPGRTPLFQVKFRLQNMPAPQLDFAGLAAAAVDLDYGMLKVDLGLELSERSEGLGGFIEYNTDLFEAGRIDQVWSDFETFLGAVAERPDAPLNTLEAFRTITWRNRSMEKSTPGPQAPSPASPAPPARGIKGARRKAVDVSPTDLVRLTTLAPGQAFPVLAVPAVPGVDLAGWVRANRPLLAQKLLAEGGVLFRGFGIKSVPQFEEVVRALSEELLDYTYRSTPRTQVSGNVYTSTEFPADQEIPLHNEMSYASSWPRKIWFCCLKAAEQGGETPLADSRKVYARLRPEVRDKYRRLGVRYVRVFGEGLDLHWHNAFQTTDRAQVEEQCRRAGIVFQWLGNDRLKTSQVCQAVATHPETGEVVWFNQAHLFHVSSLKPELRDALLAEFGEESLPRNSYYGDGSPFEPEVLDEVRAAWAAESVVFPWEEGDVVLLDNMLAAHGRRPFKGARKIVVSMAEAYSEPAR